MGRGRKTIKKCKHCNNDFEVLMIKVRAGKGLFCSQKCHQEYRKLHKQDEKQLAIFHQKKHKYGLEKNEYLRLFQKQNNACAICGTSFNDVRACVDHSHEDGKVRGLLCDNCNRGLGAFKDNIQLLLKAMDYIENINCPVAQSG